MVVLPALSNPRTRIRASFSPNMEKRRLKKRPILLTTYKFSTVCVPVLVLLLPSVRLIHNRAREICSCMICVRSPDSLS